MKTRLASFLKRNKYNYANEKRKYICEVGYDNRNYTDELGVYHQHYKSYIYRNISLDPKISIFKICYDNSGSNQSTTLTIGFSTSQALNKFVEKCPDDIRPLIKSGGVLNYADPNLTRTILIKEDGHHSKALLKSILLLMHEFDPFDKATIQVIYSAFDVPGLDPFERSIKEKLFSAYSKGTMMGFFGQRLPPELQAIIIGKLNDKDILDLSISSKSVLTKAMKAYDEEEQNVQLTMKK